MSRDERTRWTCAPTAAGAGNGITFITSALLPGISVSPVLRLLRQDHGDDAAFGLGGPRCGRGHLRGVGSGADGVLLTRVRFRLRRGAPLGGRPPPARGTAGDDSWPVIRMSPGSPVGRVAFVRSRSWGTGWPIVPRPVSGMSRPSRRSSVPPASCALVRCGGDRARLGA